ncbi:MAG: hypothetical protein ACAI34_18640, partial [Verrucomicrobium sp.]|nr:hypothetical protein [Verrucomicrobium sp.]
MCLPARVTTMEANSDTILQTVRRQDQWNLEVGGALQRMQKALVFFGAVGRGGIMVALVMLVVLLMAPRDVRFWGGWAVIAGLATLA